MGRDRCLICVREREVSFRELCEQGHCLGSVVVCGHGIIFTMSKRKGLSLDEKRDRMLDYFHEKSSVFTVQQLEKGCPKEKGIVAQSVKDVLKTLCDDDLVMFDKIEGKNFYWSFPSEVALVMRRKEETLKEAVVGLKRKREKLQEKQDTA